LTGRVLFGAVIGTREESEDEENVEDENEELEDDEIEEDPDKIFGIRLPPR
jgi:hypothetical protein